MKGSPPQSTLAPYQEKVTTLNQTISYSKRYNCATIWIFSEQHLYLFLSLRHISQNLFQVWFADQSSHTSLIQQRVSDLDGSSSPDHLLQELRKNWALHKNSGAIAAHLQVGNTKKYLSVYK